MRSGIAHCDRDLQLRPGDAHCHRDLQLRPDDAHCDRELARREKEDEDEEEEKTLLIKSHNPHLASWGKTDMVLLRDNLCTHV